MKKNSGASKKFNLNRKPLAIIAVLIALGVVLLRLFSPARVDKSTQETENYLENLAEGAGLDRKDFQGVYWHYVDQHTKFNFDNEVNTGSLSMSYPGMDSKEAQEKFEQITKYLASEDYKLDINKEELPSWSGGASLVKSEFWSDGNHVLFVNLIDIVSDEETMIKVNYLGSKDAINSAEEEQQKILDALIAYEYPSQNNFTTEQKDRFLRKYVVLNSSDSSPKVFEINRNENQKGYLAITHVISGEYGFFYYLSQEDGSIEGILSSQDVSYDKNSNSYSLDCDSLKKAEVTSSELDILLKTINDNTYGEVQAPQLCALD